VAPCDCFLFPKIKATLKGNGLEDVETIEHEVVEQVLMILKTE
jgi:hypothetical protein